MTTRTDARKLDTAHGCTQRRRAPTGRRHAQGESGEVTTRTHATRRVVVERRCAYTHARTLTRDDDSACAHNASLSTRRVHTRMHNDDDDDDAHARTCPLARRHTHREDTTTRMHARTYTQGKTTQGETTRAGGDDVCRGRRRVQETTMMCSMTLRGPRHLHPIVDSVVVVIVLYSCVMNTLSIKLKLE
jgi:hypothetical protein